MAKKSPNPLTILITAGPTVEYLDSVRYFSNGSSGKTGYAIARAAAKAGHRVILVSGQVQEPPPPGVRLAGVVSAREMLQAATRWFPECDAAVFCAAVCDYRPRRRAQKKRPKTGGRWHVELVPNPDIAASLGRDKGTRITIGFALEDSDGRRKARRKLINKRFDAIILNSPSNIGTADAVSECYTPDAGWQRWGRSSKDDLARRIVRLVEFLSAPGVSRNARRRPIR